jgi:hypothetical protein
MADSIVTIWMHFINSINRSTFGHGDCCMSHTYCSKFIRILQMTHLSAVLSEAAATSKNYVVCIGVEVHSPLTYKLIPCAKNSLSYGWNQLTTATFTSYIL